jgi:hypothetical protein
MSEDASFELQVAIVARLKNDARLTTLIAGRVYDHVPRDNSGAITATFPYVTLGPDQELPLLADCLRATDFMLQIDVWSRAVGLPEVKRIARAVEDALHETELPLTDNAFVSLDYEGRDILRDPDGLTSHAALRFRAAVDKS